MAIHIMNPNTIGSQTKELFEVTNTMGKELITTFGDSIESLKSHWKGSDAVANLTDLAKVYTAVTDLVKDLQKLIVEVNNNEVIPLVEHINYSGGSCTPVDSLAVTIQADSVISVPTDAVESWTDAAIIQDAEAFSNFPDKFGKFVTALDEAKNTLMSNWLEGASRTEVENVFKSFDENKGTYSTQIDQVSKNLNVVAENKKKLL